MVLGVMLRSALVAALLAGCSEVELGYLPEGPPPPFDNRLSVEGEVCTQATCDLHQNARVFEPLKGAVRVVAHSLGQPGFPCQPAESNRVNALS